MKDTQGQARGSSGLGYSATAAEVEGHSQIQRLKNQIRRAAEKEKEEALATVTV